jgi:hypothetical protein
LVACWNKFVENSNRSHGIRSSRNAPNVYHRRTLRQPDLRYCTY